MSQEATIPALAHAIQLAVAPVFLLSGIGAFLGVLTSRLARVVDRSRALAAEDGPGGTGRAAAGELPLLHRRIRAINRAITLCTYSALLVAAVVVALFVGALTPYSLAPAVGVLFVVAMVALIGGLTSFLQEIHIATRQFRDAGGAGR